MFQVFKRLRCPRNNSHFNTNSPPSSYRAWREISFQHTIYTFKLLHTWRKLYQSSKVGDNLELPSHLIAGKSSPFLGRWRFLSPLRAALRPLTADIQNITIIPLVAWWWFLTVSSGVIWLDTAGTVVSAPTAPVFSTTCIIYVSPIQHGQLKSQPYLTLVSTEARLSLF